MTEPTDLQTVSFPSAQDWGEWLAANHATSPGVWIKIAKKGTEAATVSYVDALEVALCYGWIDGQKGRFDDRYWLQRFTPRKARSRWSMINREKATALIEQGLMTPAGLREVEVARADGRWDAAYAGQASAVVPDDLHAALVANERALRTFEALDRVNRYAILHRLGAPGTVQTRARRIEKYIAMLERGDRFHP